MSSTHSPLPPELPATATVGTGGVFVAGVALVVSASTFVTEFTGFVRLGGAFAIALLLGFVAILPVALAVSDLAVRHPRIGGIYAFTRSVIRDRVGRQLALFLSLCFFSTFLFGGAGETMAGAHTLRTIVQSEAPVGWFVLALAVPAVVANVCGLRCATWATGGLLVLTLGVRWAIGLGGFAGWAHTGDWAWVNLAPGHGWQWGGEHGILGAGLAFGFWSFVGIDGATSLVAETREPRRSIPRGVLLGLGAILITTVVMGLGAIGTQTSAAWAALLTPGAENAPHLAIAHALFGEAGRTWMAAAAVAATWSTLLIAYAAAPRLILALARDGLLFGRSSSYFAAVDPRTGVPVRATLLVVGIQLAVTLSQSAVVDSLQAAAYLWFARYLILLALAWASRRGDPNPPGVLPRRALILVTAVGGVMIAAAWYVGFAGAHAHFGSRTLAVAAAALALTVVAWKMRNHAGDPRPEANPSMFHLAPAPANR